MKKLIFGIIMMFSLGAFGQSGTVKFLGIPVDGNKEDMINQLKQKGYRYDYDDNCLKGEFNGFEANIYVNTTKGKVDRIFVASQEMKDEAGIRVEFNNLLYSFKNNEKYVSNPSYDNEYVGDEEKISYEMSVKNKQYVAVFNQRPSKEEVADIKDGIIANFDAFKKNVLENHVEIVESIVNNDTLSIDEKADNIATIYDIAYTFGNNVWFKICEYYGQYYIGIYYDNLNNQPNGEDL